MEYVLGIFGILLTTAGVIATTLYSNWYCVIILFGIFIVIIDVEYYRLTHKLTRLI